MCRYNVVRFVLIEMNDYSCDFSSFFFVFAFPTSFTDKCSFLRSSLDFLHAEADDMI